MALSVDEISATFVRDDSLISDCNKFVQAVGGKVASEYGNSNLRGLLAGDADAIVRSFRQAPFHFIGNDKTAADEATRLANQGHFVLGGLSAAERKKYDVHATKGHVVIVARGGPSKPFSGKSKSGHLLQGRGGYPYCYQGAQEAVFRFNERTQVDVVFNKHALDHINYAYISLTS